MRFQNLHKSIQRAAALGGTLIALQEGRAAVVAVQLNSPIHRINGNPAHQNFDIDINGDGVSEVRWRSTGGAGMFRTWGETHILGMAMPGSSSNEDYPYSRPYRLDAGALIGADSPASFPEHGELAGWQSHPLQYPGSATLYVIYDVGREGNFLGQRGYLGVQFLIDGQVHYGWIDVDNDGAPPLGIPYYGLKIHGWAYETEPGKPIIAGAVPEPGVSLLFGMSLIGLAFHRHRRIALDPAH